MDAFGSPKARVITLCQEHHFAIVLNPANFKDHRRVLVQGIIKHTVELLDEAQVDILVFHKLEGKVFGLIFGGFNFHIRIVVNESCDTDGVVDECA
jgi:hypothetical protein